jgi:hypothetical protein
MRKFLIVGFALIVVIGVAIVYLYASLDRIIQIAIETIGSDLMRTEVRLGEVEISLTSGNGALRGFRVTNPRGFSAEDAFRFDEVNVTVDISTIRSDPVVIKEINIEAPRVIYEFAGGTSNLDTLNDNVQGEIGEPGTGSGGDGPNIVIEKILLRNGVVGISARKLDQLLEVPLPTVHMVGVGKGGKGATPGEIARQVMGEMLASARRAATNANLDPDDLKKSADEIAGEARKKIEEAAKETGGAVEQRTGGSGKLIEGLTKGAGGN